MSPLFFLFFLLFSHRMPAREKDAQPMPHLLLHVRPSLEWHPAVSHFTGRDLLRDLQYLFTNLYLQKYMVVSILSLMYTNHMYFDN